jgi:hypothetical protein
MSELRAILTTRVPVPAWMLIALVSLGTYYWALDLMR